MQNNVAYGPFSNSNGRRRRQSGSSYLYTVGLARIFYSTPCSSSADKGKFSNSTSISSCVKNRLAACNAVFGNTGSPYPWTIPSGLILSAVDITFSNYIKLAVSAIAGVLPSTGVPFAASSNFGLSANTTSELCKQKFIKFTSDIENECFFF